MTFEQAAEKLEFDRILARIQRHISSDPGREILGSLPVLTSLSEIRTELAQVTEFKRVLEVEGDIPLEGISRSRRRFTVPLLTVPSSLQKNSSRSDRRFVSHARFGLSSPGAQTSIPSSGRLLPH